MDILQGIIENSNIPILTAFVLGILTAISPCPLATNITAIGYISKDINNKNVIFFNGLLYMLGRIFTYSVIGFIIIPIIRSGASAFTIQKSIGMYGELIIGPVLIIIGLFMLFGDKLNLPKIRFKGGENLKRRGSLGALLLGILFAFAFCPTSGVLYFGMLIPMSAATSYGYLLPIIFAVATGLPVMIIAWILAYSVAGIGNFYNKMALFQKWFNVIIATLFILVGIYYIIMLYS